MTLKEIRDLITEASGRTIQFRSDTADQWQDLKEHGDTIFGAYRNSYRIKPTPKLRPWKPEEVPVGALYRTKEHASVTVICALIPDDRCPIRFVSFSDGCTIAGDGVQTAFIQREHSTDGGKTWKPCGVVE